MFKVFIVSLLFAGSVSAAEVRFLESLPTSGKTNARKLSASKKPGWFCQWAKTDENSGNTNKTKKSKTYVYELSAVPELTDAQDAKINELLDSGKRVVKCTLKERDSEAKKMINAELEGDDEE